MVTIYVRVAKYESGKHIASCCILAVYSIPGHVTLNAIDELSAELTEREIMETSSLSG